MERSRGGGFGFAQCRQDAPSLGLCCRRGGGAGGAFGNLFFGGGERGLRGIDLGGGGDPFEVQQDRLGTADVAGNVAEPRCLPGLALEALQLGLQRLNHVVEAFDVGFGGAQAQFSLVAARMEAADAGRFLEDAAALLRLGVDDGADLSLADDGGRIGARFGIGEQKLHVAHAHFVAAYQITRALLALDAARDFQFIEFVECSRCAPLGIVDQQRDFGQVADRPRAGATEDHIVHFAATHALGRGLAHDPAQRLDDIGLAAPVGADNAGDARFDHQFGRIDERLESGNA